VISLGLANSIIALIKSAVDNSIATISDDVTVEDIVDLARNQQLLPIVYYGVMNSKVAIPQELSSEIEQAFLTYVYRDQTQAFELTKVLNAFVSKGIDHMPVKGMLLKLLYPASEMRLMGDGDILIKLSQKEEIFAVMKELGYKEVTESPHEFVFSKRGVCVELHKCLVPPYNKDYYAYYGDGWQLAKIREGASSRYSMNDEDHFVYIFTHFAKHYRDGGIGVQHLVDFWVYMNKKKVDMDYVRGELKKLGLLKFFENILLTIDVWFNGAAPTDLTDYITVRMFSNGVFGTSDIKNVASAIRSTGTNSARGARIKHMVETFFPNLHDMQGRYPILKEYKFLLPVMWIARFFDVLFFKRDRLHNKIGELKHVNEENISTYQQELDYVGLHFDFKE